MIETLITLVLVVVAVLIIAYVLRWLMSPEMWAAPPIAQKVVWTLFVLIVLLAVAGLLGYGPLRGPWR